MRRCSHFRSYLALAILAACLCASAQETTLRARVQMTRNGHPVKDASQAVLWLTPIGGTAPLLLEQKPSEIPKLVQKDKSFHPSLIVVPVGGKVEFPNRDPFFHNVFSLFEGKRFDLGLYESGTTRFVQFDKPGISYIFCNIHAQMAAVIIALRTPYYGISDSHGEIDIPDLPPGRYSLKIFHASVAPASLLSLDREITVASGNNFIGPFKLSESELPHQNKYGHDYEPPQPDTPAYSRP